MSDAPPPNGQDAAWVTIETPFDAVALRAFLNNVQLLYRINSQMVFEELVQQDARRYHLKAKNLSNENNLDLLLQVTPEEDGIKVTYSKGLKAATRFHITDKPNGTADLIVKDTYGGASEREREERIDEVDKSLVQWGHDLHRYFQNWKRWSWLPGWKWYMQRVWQPMKPSARRISYMLILITLVEFVFFLFVFFIFWLETSS